MSEPIFSEHRIRASERGISFRVGAAAANGYLVSTGRRAKLRSIYAMGTSGEAIIAFFDAASGVSYGSGTGVPVIQFALKGATLGSGPNPHADFTLGANQLRGVEFYSSINVFLIDTSGINQLTAAQYSGGPIVAIGVYEY